MAAGAELLELRPQLGIPAERLRRPHPLGRALLPEEGAEGGLQQLLLLAQREVGAPQHELVGCSHPVVALLDRLTSLPPAEIAYGISECHTGKRKRFPDGAGSA